MIRIYSVRTTCKMRCVLESMKELKKTLLNEFFQHKRDRWRDLVDRLRRGFHRWLAHIEYDCLDSPDVVMDIASVSLIVSTINIPLYLVPRKNYIDPESLQKYHRVYLYLCYRIIHKGSHI